MILNSVIGVEGISPNEKAKCLYRMISLNTPATKDLVIRETITKFLESHLTEVDMEILLKYFINHVRSKKISDFLKSNLDTVAFEDLLNVVNFDLIVGAKGKYFYQAVK